MGKITNAIRPLIKVINLIGLRSLGALLVFFLYSFSTPAQSLYPARWLLWVAMVPMAVWLIRMVVLGYRGRQDYDPIVFARIKIYNVKVVRMSLL